MEKSKLQNTCGMLYFMPEKKKHEYVKLKPNKILQGIGGNGLDQVELGIINL